MNQKILESKNNSELSAPYYLSRNKTLISRKISVKSNASCLFWAHEFVPILQNPLLITENLG